MHILVTGGTGRIGRLVVAELLRRGDAVASLDLQPCGRRQRGFREVIGRFDDVAAVEAATDGVDAVLHLGALMSWIKGEAPKVYAANVTGTFNVLQAAVRLGVKKLVFASSGEVYPETKPVYLPLDESHPTRPTSAYGLSKLLGEQMVEFHQRVHGLGSVILRFSHTQDAGELLDPGSFFSGPRFYLRARIRQQERVGNAKVVEALRPLDDGTERLLLSRGEDGKVFRMPIADSRDICAGVLQALDSDRAVGQVMNLGPDEAVSFDQAIAALQKATRLPVVEARLPMPAVDYVTSRARAREILGYRTRWSFEDMVADAAQRRGR
jgi:UDP-glucose 4-epimerase